MSTTRPRLPAAERRAALLETACCMFSRGSYRGSTTAEIARAAGITEPVLYRHFDSKRDLYLACLDEAWARLRALWDETLAAEPDPAEWVGAIGRAAIRSAALGSQTGGLYLTNLWVQALTEASDDPVIREHLQAHLREVHAYVEDVMRRSQEAGGVERDRDASAEAWIFISIGLLDVVGRRIGGLLEQDFPRIVASRRRWLVGR